MIALQGRSLQYRAGGSDLVADVDIEVAHGELVAVVGPNGAGKSTLIGLLAGDLSPMGGEIRLEGQSLGTLPSSDVALRRSVLAQSQITDIPFTAHAVVSMGRFPHRIDPENSRERDRQAVERALIRTDTAHLADRVVATLSGGERARVALARILAQATRVILLDEPTAALDVSHQERIMREVRAEAAAGNAVVAVMHDLNAAAFYADRLILMAEGRIVTQGDPGDVIVESILSSVYGQAMKVIDHPFRNCPLVLLTD